MSDIPLKLQTVTESPLNQETPLRGLNMPLTPNDLFYVRNHFAVPEIDLNTWRLEFNGGVKNPRHFSFADLQAMPSRTLTVVFECAGNGRTTLDPPPNGTRWGLGAVSQAQFTGVPLVDLLKQFTIADDVIEVLFTGADSGSVRTGESTAYGRSLSLSASQNSDILLCWAMNGEPLSPQHGYPLRLVVPNWYGMAAVKWLNQISLITEPYRGFFQSDDYVYVQDPHEADGTPVENIKVRALLTAPEAGELPLGEHQFSGVAWSGEGEIVSVEYSFDEGKSWQLANLASNAERYSWVNWSAEVLLSTVGKVVVWVRATDSSGNTQPLTQRWNKGGYVNNMAQRVSFEVKD